MNINKCREISFGILKSRYFFNIAIKDALKKPKWFSNLKKNREIPKTFSVTFQGF
jgi:hypothetical protein